MAALVDECTKAADEVESGLVPIRRPSFATRHSLSLALYFLALSLLLVRLDAHPPFVYNWEHYTAWAVFAFWDHPSLAILRPIDGLMTGSGRSPLIAAVAWLTYHIGGVGIGPLRLATALIAAAAVPLLRAAGETIVGRREALLAALLLALSPVFLLYGRTATVVGSSLVPALATTYALLRVAQRPADRRWLVALQVLLCAGMWTYAPARFLWPLAIILLAGERYLRPNAPQRAIRRALLVTVAVLPIVVSLASWPRSLLALADYYAGRDENVFALTFVPEYYGAYIRPPAGVEHPGPPEGNRVTLAARLLAQNVGDYVNLLLDRGTAPALTDYWNQGGRLYPAFLVPFFLIGLAGTLRRAPRQTEARALLLHFFGFGLPMILTSRVHIGRLIFVLPFLCLLVATGLFALLEWLRALFFRWRGVALPPATARVIALGVTCALLAMTARATWLDYRAPPALANELAVVDLLRADRDLIGQRGAAVIVLDRSSRAVPLELEEEERRVSDYRLHLDRLYRFVNLAAADRRPLPPGDTRPAIYFGGILDALRTGEPLPSPCDAVYYIAPATLAEAEALLQRRQPACAAGIVVRQLPGL